MKIRVSLSPELVEACQRLWPADPSTACEHVLTMKKDFLSDRHETSAHVPDEFGVSMVRIGRIGNTRPYAAAMGRRIISTNNTKTAAIADMQTSIDGLNCPKEQKAELYEMVKAMIDKAM